MSGILSKDTTLGYSETLAGAATIIVGLQSFPDMGSEPESVDVTTLADSTMAYIDGLSDPGSLQYECLYILEEFSALEALRGKTLYFTQTYPDGSKHTWRGQGTPVLAGKGVNEAMTYTYFVKPATEISFTPAP